MPLTISFQSLKLDSTPHDRQSRGPIFFRRAVVLFGNRQVVQRRQWTTGKLFHQLLTQLLVRPVRMLQSQSLRAPKNVRH